MYRNSCHRSYRVAALAAAAFAIATFAAPRLGSASLLHIGGSFIWDNGSEDLDPTVNTIRIDPFNPIGLPDLTVRNVTVEFLESPGEVSVTTTSSTIQPGQTWNLGVAPMGEVAPFEVEFMAPVPPLSEWAPEGGLAPGAVALELTTHLQGSYTFESTVGPSEPATSHASASFHAEVVTLEDTLVFPPLDGGSVENRTASYPVAPPDRSDDLVVGEDAIQYLRGRLALDLGPGAGLELPVSAKLTLRVVPEPGAAAAAFTALAALGAAPLASRTLRQSASAAERPEHRE